MAELDQLDPVARELAVTGMLDQCRTWLATAVEATEPKRISEFKAFVATIAETTKQLNLSKRIQLDATEMVRRAERGIGVAIRRGQAEGAVIAPGKNPHPARSAREGSGDTASFSPPRPVTDFATRDELSGDSGNGIYAMTDEVSDEEFNEAIAKAKDEENLSKANIVRKIKGVSNPIDRRKKLAELAEKGYSSRQIAKMAGYSDGDLCRAVPYRVGKGQRCDLHRHWPDHTDITPGSSCLLRRPL